MWDWMYRKDLQQSARSMVRQDCCRNQGAGTAERYSWLAEEAVRGRRQDRKGRARNGRNEQLALQGAYRVGAAGHMSGSHTSARESRYGALVLCPSCNHHFRVDTDPGFPGGFEPTAQQRPADVNHHEYQCEYGSALMWDENPLGSGMSCAHRQSGAIPIRY